MPLEDVQLDHGAFQFTMPYEWRGWLGWVIGILFLILGFVLAFQEPLAMGLVSIGALIIALTSPASLEADLHSVRKNAAQPADLEAQALDKGLTIDSWWLGRHSYVPTTDPSDWILPAPGPASWSDSHYAPHGEGKALAEHPHNVGTPRPAAISTYGVMMVIFLFGISVVSYVAMTSGVWDDETQQYVKWTAAPFVVLLIGLIWLTFGFFAFKRVRLMLDTPTSLVRSVSVGPAELVGQVRPAEEGVLRVVVDGNQSRVVPHCVGYHWSYEVYICRQVRDKDGNTRTECHWQTVRSDSGSIPFILNDGTGGVKIHPETFKKIDYGQYLKRWESSHADTLKAHVGMELAARIFTNGDVRKHRWTVYALRLGNPVYMLGNVQSRNRGEIESLGLDSSVAHHNVEVTGEDNQGMKAMMMRGTELSNIGRFRSTTELMILPILAVMVGIGLLLFL